MDEMEFCEKYPKSCAIGIKPTMTYSEAWNHILEQMSTGLLLVRSAAEAKIEIVRMRNLD